MDAIAQELGEDFLVTISIKKENKKLQGRINEIRDANDKLKKRIERLEDAIEELYTFKRSKWGLPYNAFSHCESKIPR